MTQSYEKPEIRDLGSVQAITQQKHNKVGGTPDALSAIDPTVVGSYVPYNG